MSSPLAKRLAEALKEARSIAVADGTPFSEEQALDAALEREPVVGSYCDVTGDFNCDGRECCEPEHERLISLDREGP